MSTVTLRANLKALRVRPAREPGDKPVLEIVLRSEVDSTTIQLTSKAGKDMTVAFTPDPELQPELPLPERYTVTDPDGIVISSELGTNGVDHEPYWQEQTGVGTSAIAQGRRRRRGTVSSEQ